MKILSCWTIELGLYQFKEDPMLAIKINNFIEDFLIAKHPHLKEEAEGIQGRIQEYLPKRKSSASKKKKGAKKSKKGEKEKSKTKKNKDKEHQKEKEKEKDKEREKEKEKEKDKEKEQDKDKEIQKQEQPEKDKEDKQPSMATIENVTEPLVCPLDVTKQDPSHLAAQMTLVEWELFSELVPSEFVHHAWKSAPQTKIGALIAHFNKVSDRKSVV